MKRNIGDTIRISKDNDNENYNKFRDKDLIITHIANNREEHPGYDEGVNEPLYDLKTLQGEEVPFSLYEYEVE